jgi:tetratricopeptide (TPR) repeat protein
MRCGRARRHISEYVDGTLSPERQDWLRRHTDKCAGCRQLLRDFQAMACEAKELERLSPPDDAWLRIRAGIREARARETRPGRAARTDTSIFRPVFLRPRLVPAMAAAAAVVLVAAVGFLYLQPWQTTMSAEKMAVDSFTLTKLDEAEKHYEEAVKALNEALSAQKGDLDPEVAKVFETNLALVDASIRTCQQAVRRDPRDLEAQYALLDSYREKVQLMTGFISARRASGQGESPAVGL